MKLSRILIVRLPCKKIYPLGPVYLMSLLRRAHPQSSQRLLDLALVRPHQRTTVLQEVLRKDKPDVIAFSWRDIQIFSPHDMDPAMRDAFIFFHDPSPAKRIIAAFKGLGHILSYQSGIAENLRLIRTTINHAPGSVIAVGGPSVRIFGENLRSRFPSQARLFPQANLEVFFQLLALPPPEDPLEPELELDFLETAFPEWCAYREEQIGIQTKQGCPHACLYCLYGFLEGREVRRRNPARVVREMKEYHRRWGSRRFWFADSQLLSGPRDRQHLSEILEGLLLQGLNMNWSGYLRINSLDQELAGLMVRTGLSDLEISLNSGSQVILDQLHMGLSVEEVVKGCEILRRAGYPGRIFINLSLNAPGETRETLLETIAVIRRIRDILGDQRVVPVLFFLAIQPHTGLERKAMEEGYLKAGYDPLSPYPWAVRKLIYNPPPLDRLIGRCCARAFRSPEDSVGSRVLAYLEEELLRSPSP
ncbi:MAG: radical SAM protein [Deltaproteobacteria bacterium]|nr:MAG: radical SAM protein [Deltaproteobacteria bacterium]